MSLSNEIMRCAARLMPQDQAGWAAAMQSEYELIRLPSEQLTFAAGCFYAAMQQAAQTRKGLNFIGRALVATALSMISLAGLIISQTHETAQMTILISGLCFFYAGAAALTLVNLRGLRLYAGLGLCAAIISWIGVKLTGFETVELSHHVFNALSFEVIFTTGAIFVTAIYLSLIAHDRAAL